MSLLSKLGEFSNVNGGGKWETCLNVIKDINSYTCHTDSLELPDTVSMQMECERSESTDETNSDNEVHNFVGLLVSLYVRMIAPNLLQIFIIVLSYCQIPCLMFDNN